MPARVAAQLQAKVTNPVSSGIIASRSSSSCGDLPADFAGHGEFCQEPAQRSSRSLNWIEKTDNSASAASLQPGDDDSITTQAQHQAGALRLEVHDHAGIILKPQVPSARLTQRKAITTLNIGAGKLRQTVQLVDFAIGVEGRSADATHAKTANFEGICLTLVV